MAVNKDATQTVGAADLEPTSTVCQSEMLSFRIAFDDGSPQYLSGESE